MLLVFHQKTKTQSAHGDYTVLSAFSLWTTSVSTSVRRGWRDGDRLTFDVLLYRQDHMMKVSDSSYDRVGEWESVHVRWGDICVEKTCGNFALINSTWTQWQNMPQTMKKGYIGCWSLLVNVPFNWPWRRERLGKRPLHFGYLDRFHVMWEQDRKTKVGISLQPPNSRWISATRGLLPFKNQSLHS